MLDGFGRRIEYLRVSVTDRCNLRCRYCMPAQGVPPQSHADILRYEEIERLVRVAVELGFRRVRVTGGEPLVRKGIVEFVGRLAALDGLEDISMTTNGLLLADLAAALKEAGLRRVNISLDTLRPERFASITRRDEFGQAWAGVMAALHVGLAPTKVNVVLLRGINDDEIEDFALLTRHYPLWVRFIELMPLGRNGAWGENRFLSAEEIWPRLNALGPLQEVEAGDASGGPARYYAYPGAPGRVGLITPLSRHFCQTCNRLRLTADGRLDACLAGEKQVDVREALRSGASDGELAGLLARAVALKPERHQMLESSFCGDKAMSRLGG